MAIKAPPMTSQEFEEFALLPENADRRLELISGELVELVSNQKSARLAARMLILIGAYLEQQPIGYVTISEGGYHVGSDRYMPDVGYISKARQPDPSEESYNSLAPDLAVEVVFPTDETGNVVAKTNSYLLAGTTVWLVYPKQKEVHVYIPGQPTRKLNLNDILDDGEVLPGFSAKLQDIFVGE